MARPVKEFITSAEKWMRGKSAKSSKLPKMKLPALKIPKWKK